MGSTPAEAILSADLLGPGTPGIAGTAQHSYQTTMALALRTMVAQSRTSSSTVMLIASLTITLNSSSDTSVALI
jgi:hypothetical protein